MIPGSKMDMVCWPTMNMWDPYSYTFTPMDPTAVAALVAPASGPTPSADPMLSLQNTLFSRLNASAPLKWAAADAHRRKEEHDELCVKREGLTPRSAGLMRLFMLPNDARTGHSDPRLEPEAAATYMKHPKRVLSTADDALITVLVSAKCRWMLQDYPYSLEHDNGVLTALRAKPLEQHSVSDKLKMLATMFRIEERALLTLCAKQWKP